METRMINEGWTKVNGEKIDDLELYILNQMASKENMQMYIGTDSLRRTEGKSVFIVKYLSVIVFRHIGIPCTNHVIMRRAEERAAKAIPTPVKLNGEVNRTAELALFIREKIGIDPEVHLDLNPAQGNGSFEVYNYIRGYFESLGFECEYKPSDNSWSASAVADYFL